MFDILELNDKLVGELKEIARQLNIPNYDELRKQELVYKILDHQALHPEATTSIKSTMESKKATARPETPAAKDTKPMKTESSSESDAKTRRRRVSPRKDESSEPVPAFRTDAAPPPPPQPRADEPAVVVHSEPTYTRTYEADRFNRDRKSVG